MPRNLSASEVGALWARDFWGDEFWNRTKRDYDECMFFRKSMKGKPDDADRAVLEMNKRFIDYYDSILYHSPALGAWRCECKRCAKWRAERTEAEARPALKQLA